MHSKAVLGYLPKLKKGLGLAFGIHFLHDSSIIMFFVEYSINWQSFNVNFFPPQKIKQNVSLSSYLHNYDAIKFKIYLRSSSKAMADREKRGKTNKQKFEYLENEKSFLDEIESIFHDHLEAIIWLKKWKLMGTNFKEDFP